jgi:sec-independent protein translocase protein TatA
MGSLTPLHWILVLIVALLVFGGRGKLSGLMGDAAKGIKAFREGLKGEDEAHEQEPAKPLPETASKTASATRAKTKA